MTPAELRAVCVTAREQGLEHTILVVTRAREPRGCRPRVRVFPGCLGTVVGSQDSKRKPGHVELIVDVLLADVERYLERLGA